MTPLALIAPLHPRMAKDIQNWEKGCPRGSLLGALVFIFRPLTRAGVLFVVVSIRRRDRHSTPISLSPVFEKAMRLDRALSHKDIAGNFVHQLHNHAICFQNSDFDAVLDMPRIWMARWRSVRAALLDINILTCCSVAQSSYSKVDPNKQSYHA